MRKFESLNDVPDTMEVTVSVSRAVVVDYNVDTFHINTTTENIGSDKNTLLECLESSVAVDTMVH